MISDRWAPTPARAFALFFVGSLLLGLVFQWLILPRTPWYAGYGLMSGGDWVQFFDQGRELAAKIRAEGWKVWELRYQGQWPASLMAAAFVVTGWEHPSAVLPIYAAVYGLTAAVVVRIAQSLGVFGLLTWAMLAVLAFPSTVLIWGQPHKDAFVLGGFFILAWAWSIAWREESCWRWLYVVVLVIAGVVLMWLPRPYLLEVVLSAIWIGLVASMLALFSSGHLLRGILLFGIVAATVVGLRAVEKVEKVDLCDTWQPEVVVPFIHEKMGVLLCYRHGFIQTFVYASGSLDHDRLLVNYREFGEYLPRAIFLAIAAPIPRMCSFLGACKVTSPGGEVKRLLASIEMIVFYMVMVGWLGWLLPNGEENVRSLWTGLFLFAWAVGVFYVMTSPNEGTLYRLRYPEIALWWIGGIGGWRRLGGRFFAQKRENAHA